jgi:hypothetical protein
MRNPLIYIDTRVAMVRKSLVSAPGHAYSRSGKRLSYRSTTASFPSLATLVSLVINGLYHGFSYYLPWFYWLSRGYKLNG